MTSFNHRGQRLATFVAIMAVNAALAPAVSAQSSAWGTNGYFSINAVQQGDPKSFKDEISLTIDHEAGDLVSDNRIAAGPAFDITAGGRLKGNLGFGFGASYFRRGSIASVTARLPHPFYFDRLRAVGGEADHLTREELAAHVHLMWLLPVTKRFQAAVFAGPSRFTLKQMMVANVEYTEAYPFDEAQFVAVKPVQQRANRYGYNAGADVSFFFSRYVGVGALLRVSRATVKLASPDGGEVDVKAGGTQIGAGVRLRF